MKTVFRIALILATGFFIEPSFDASTYIFCNYYPPRIDAPVFDANVNRLEGTNYMAILYGGPQSDSLMPAWASVGDVPVPFDYYAPNSQAGYFAYPGYLEIRTAIGFELPWLQVRAWDSRLGRSYEEVVSLGLGGYGESDLFQKFGGGFPALPEPLIGLQSFSLRPVIPEPSSALLFLFCVFLLIYGARRSR